MSVEIKGFFLSKNHDTLKPMYSIQQVATFCQGLRQSSNIKSLVLPKLSCGPDGYVHIASLLKSIQHLSGNKKYSIWSVTMIMYRLDIKDFLSW